MEKFTIIIPVSNESKNLMYPKKKIYNWLKKFEQFLLDDEILIMEHLHFLKRFKKKF